MAVWENILKVLGIKKTKSKTNSDTIRVLVKSDDKVEGIYIMHDKQADKPYIGQSGDIAERLNQHTNSGKLSEDDLADVKIIEVDGGKLLREIEEQRKIDAIDGIASKKLSNKRNPVSEKRQLKLGIIISIIGAIIYICYLNQM